MTEKTSETDALLTSKDDDGGADEEAQTAPPTTPSAPRRMGSGISPQVQEQASVLLGRATTGAIGEMFVRSASRTFVASDEAATTSSAEESGANVCLLLCFAILLMLVTTAALSFMGFLAVGFTSLYYGIRFTQEAALGFQIGALLSVSLFGPLLVGGTIALIVYPCLVHSSLFFCFQCLAYLLMALAILIVFPGMFLSMGLMLAHYYSDDDILPAKTVFWSSICAILFHTVFGALTHCICGVEVPTADGTMQRSSGFCGKYLPPILSSALVAKIYGFNFFGGAIVGLFGLGAAVVPILYKLENEQEQ